MSLRRRPQIMPRTVNLEALVAPGGPPPEQDAALPVPAKTRLYVEQTQVQRWARSGDGNRRTLAVSPAAGRCVLREPLWRMRGAL